MAGKLKQTAGFKLIQDPECTNVCFWYIPPSLRGQEETPEWLDKLAKVKFLLPVFSVYMYLKIKLTGANK